MFRIFPRLILVAYTIGLMVTVSWYMDFEIVPEVNCDSAVMQVLLDRGETIDVAERISCRQVGVIGRPLGYTGLLSAMFGAGAVFFGFYTNSGWKWNDHSNRRYEKNKSDKLQI